MNELLKIGAIIVSESSNRYKIQRFLGGGGQGEVYQAERNGQVVAVKWYAPQSATPSQRKILQDLVEHGAPSNCFLWPEEVLECQGTDGFGYAMRLRPSNFVGMKDLMTGKISPTFLSLVIASFETTKAFRSLHTEGFCYRDISFGNLFFDPTTGDVLICDNDNVGPANQDGAGVLGTADFMAPEVVRHECLPSTKTDLYSLSVLLFYLFFISHPLAGRRLLSIHCWDLPAREKLFGTEPIFIFDPADRSNEAVPPQEDPYCEAGGNALVYWDKIYPTLLKETFTKAFTVGLRDADLRITEYDWMGVLSSLRDSLFTCTHCGSKNFHDHDIYRANGATPRQCWKCGRIPDLPPRLRIGRAVVLLNSDCVLYPHHVAPGRPAYEFRSPIAKVVQHPTDRRIWGLQNSSPEKWILTTASGTRKDVEPGRSVPLANGTRVLFGGVEGEIRF